MAHTMRILLLMALLAASHLTSAQSEHELRVGAQNEQLCDAALLSKIGAKLQIVDFDNKVLASACKQWPKNKDLTVVALSYDKGEEYKKELAIVFVNTNTGKIASTYLGSIEEDGATRVDSGSLWIDTARYDLAPNVRAFGIDVTSGYIPHCNDGGWGAIRTLFVFDGPKIRPILDSLTMSTWSYVQGGNPRCMSQEYADKAPPTVIEHSVLTIDVSKHRTNGYADLVITPYTSTDNDAKSKQRGKQTILQYDGKKYPNVGPGL